MRIDHILYKRSTLSVPKGYLQVLPDNTVTFTKYKDQLEGRLNVFLWIISNIVIQFMQDKELVNLKKEEIKAIDYAVNKVGVSFGGKYGELLIKANDNIVMIGSSMLGRTRFCFMKKGWLLRKVKVNTLFWYQKLKTLT